MSVKIAIAGAGYIAAIHARAVRFQKDAELVAVVEKFLKKRDEFATAFELSRSYETIEQLLAEGGVDAVVIGTPNFLHAPQSIAALQAGVHVMVEKPMAMNTIEAQTMMVASQKNGALLMVAHCWRFDREVQWLRQQVQSGKLGRIVRTKGCGVHVHWGPEGWFTQAQYAGGGALADMGVHALDTARYLLGDPQPLSVYARIGTHYTNYDVDDTGVILVNWGNGATSYIESGWWQPHADGPESATQLYGLNGFGQLFPTFLELPNLAEKKIDVVDPGFPHPRAEHCPQEMYNSQMAHFVECIRQERIPVPGALEGLVNMRLIDGAYQSAREERLVVL